MHIGIATLTRGELPADYVASLINLVSSINGQYTLILNKSGLITIGRNSQFFEAAKSKVDYLLMIDSDIVFPKEALQKLIALNKDIATGIYYKRDYPFRPEIHKLTDDLRIINLDSWPSEPFQVDSCGAGFLLISKKVLNYFKKTDPEPEHPFNLIVNKTCEFAGEDTSFCIRCKFAGFEIWTDPSIRLGHIRHDIVWPEYFQAAKDKIEGNLHLSTQQIWTNNEETNWLTKMASKMETVLEVGAWKGRSTIALLQGNPELVYTVDHFRGSAEDVHKKILEKEEPLFVQFARNIGDHRAVVLKMTSLEASKLFADNSLDMVFIDGGHTYEEVKHDIEIWLPKVRKIICGHDYTPGWPGVVKAVNKKFKRKHKVISSIWYVEK